MKLFLHIALICLAPVCLNAQQYTVNGNAVQNNCHCYTLTQNSNNQSGSVWNNIKIDLSISFNFVFDVNLGCSDDNGADGIAFVLQPISTSVGSLGGGLGYQGISPAIGITLDTYQNMSPDNDPTYDHIAIQRNGVLDHLSSQNLAGPIAISATNNNVEDCADHTLRIIWDAPTKTLSTFFDNVPRLSIVNDLVNTTFGGNPMVYWGFTGSTGGLFNVQKFCTALTPQWSFGPAQKRCINESITFNNTTISFAPLVKFYWDFGDGSNIDSVNLSPTHTYTTAGTFTVTLRVLGADGCEETNAQLVSIGSKPVAAFYILDSCLTTPIVFNNTSYVTVGTLISYYWDLDNNGITSTLNSPTTVYTSPGQKNIKLVTTSIEGCQSDTLYKLIRIHDIPVANFNFTDSVCIGSSITFTGNSFYSGGPINGWLWIIDGFTIIPGSSSFTYAFITPGNHTIGLMTHGTARPNECFSNTVVKNVFITNKPIAAIKTQNICEQQQISLRDSSYTTDGFAITSWWWDLGIGQFSTLQNPFVTYNAPGQKLVRLVVRNSRNCISDTLNITLNIASKPIAKFGISETLCNNSQVFFMDSSLVNNSIVNQWNWIYNNSIYSNIKNASGIFVPGPHTMGLSVTSALGCISDTVYHAFQIKTKPAVSMNFRDACKRTVITFTATETTAVGINSWYWDFGDGQPGIGNPINHTYATNNNYTVKLYGISTEGCSSDTITGRINIYGTNAFAGNDIVAAEMQPVQLIATGGISYEWSPSTGLTATNIPNPIATNSSNRYYYLKAFTPEGCESYDTILIKIYKGPEIYVPGAFTPNDDGKNDILKAIPVGISNFGFFVIYNRYGQKIFYTTDYNKGWDGKLQGLKQSTGAFTWMAEAIDFKGNKIFRKGTVLIIR
ncbi:MAG: PKD domain-containing protein [Ferruginibacter sp.]